MTGRRVAALLAVVVAGAATTACGGGAGGDQAAFCAGLEALGDQVADGDAAGDAEGVLDTVNDLLATAPRGAALTAADEVGDAVERLDPTVPATVVAFTDTVADELGPQAEAVCDLDAADLADAPPPPVPEVPADDLPLDDLPLDEFPFEDFPLDEFPFEDFPLDEFPFEDFPLDDLPVAPDAPPLGDALARGEAGTGDVGDRGVLEVVLVGDGRSAEVTVFGLDGFDPTLTVRDEGGDEVAFNDDDLASFGLDSRLELDIPAGERWTAEIRAYEDRGPGTVTITYD
jgi:hypothetical protein